jgi:hypothetical protein
MARPKRISAYQEALKKADLETQDCAKKLKGLGCYTEYMNLRKQLPSPFALK